MKDGLITLAMVVILIVANKILDVYFDKQESKLPVQVATYNPIYIGE